MLQDINDLITVLSTADGNLSVAQAAAPFNPAIYPADLRNKVQHHMRSLIAMAQQLNQIGPDGQQRMVNTNANMLSGYLNAGQQDQQQPQQPQGQPLGRVGG